jgi:hypothetical protein
MGVADKADFIVDDISNSGIASGFASRIICIGVTPTLPDDNAFRSLIAHLDRISRRDGIDTADRRVVLGQNCWGPGRLDVVRETLEATRPDYALAFKSLNLLGASWWMQPRHLEIIREYFSSVTILAETKKIGEGVRTEYLLQ